MATQQQGRGREAARWLVGLVLGVGVMLAGGGAAADDAAPAVLAVVPAVDADDVALAATVTVTFSEPVTLAVGALELGCERSGQHPTAAQGDGQTFTFTPDSPFAPGERCTALLRQEAIADQDDDDPPDQMAFDFSWSFNTIPPPLLINELDPLTADDMAEFIELFDGGAGHTALDGLTLVFYRGDEDSVYLALDLGGYETDGRGYFVVGGPAIDADLRLAVGSLRDGPDAVALYAAPKSNFLVGGPVVTEALLDAVVYAPGGAHDAGLVPLLLAGQPLDEAQRDAATTDSLQRYPNGDGAARDTSTYVVYAPTPDAPNQRLADDAPRITAVWPENDATIADVATIVEVTFSEPVILHNQPVEISCSLSGTHAYALNGGGTTFRFRPYLPLMRGESCTTTVFGDRLSDADLDDPPDGMLADYAWSFATTPPVPQNVLINEIDADTLGSDSAEFIELYDGGGGHTLLDGLLVVLFNGSDDRSYRTIDLSGHETDAAGYFLLANAAVAGADVVLPNGVLQNGTDAVVLLDGQAADYPNDTAVTGLTPLDAVVYGPVLPADTELLVLLNGGQSAVDEDGRGEAESHSNQRCPNGGGGPRNTAGFRQNTPTPRAASNCVTDTAPTLTQRSPAPGAASVTVATAVSVTFSEPVDVNGAWLTITCAQSGAHPYATTGGPVSFVLQPTAPFANEEACTVTVKSGRVRDLDTDDPPDTMVGNLTWQFTTAGAPPDFLLINEIDPDTPSSDTAEFIELYDGDRGTTALDGLALVFYNGYANTVYYAIDLDGQRTNAAGYWVAGNVALSPDLVFANGGLQNGPDAVALYAGEAAHFTADSPLTTTGLLDAVVYGDAAGAAGLLPLLLTGETAVDEDGRDAADRHSIQRCPNGAGGQRRTDAFRPNDPTPGAPSHCTADDPPMVLETTPSGGAAHVAVDSTLAVVFSEPMTADAGWLRLVCAGVERALMITMDGATTYTATPIAPLPHNALCNATIDAERLHDADNDDPPDTLASDFSWGFTTLAPVADNMLINELDADTPGSDTAEFIELYDGGRGMTALDGLTLVFYNGYANTAYFALDLDGQRTNSAGYWFAGNTALAPNLVFTNSSLQNGPDAVALYAGDATQFPANSPLRTEGLIDAVVYGDAGGAAGLLPLLLSGEVAVDEGSRGAADRHSVQRCPNGAGGQRRTAAFRANNPTPGTPSHCIADDPPTVLETTPAGGAAHVPIDAYLTVEFSEPMVVAGSWLRLACAGNERALTIVPSGPTAYTATPTASLPYHTPCTATVDADLVQDADSDDPPNQPAEDFIWSFTTRAQVADNVLINELDADTPSSDTAEFIELFDGGVGDTDLSGLVLVLFNGKDDRAYYAVDLDNTRTDGDGLAVIGSAGLGGAIDLPTAVIQNGADAVALYEGDAADFPAGTPVTTNLLRDAIVYGTADPTDAGLLPLLAAGEAQFDEAARGAADLDSAQRCPDGAGGARRTAAYRANRPTPGAPNDCAADIAPTVTAVAPPANAGNVATGATLSVQFSEPVTLDENWFAIVCATSGNHAAEMSGGPTHYTLTPALPFAPGESCAVTLHAAAVHDTDSDDPPDRLTADFVWHFDITPGQPAPDGILINELDSDTPGNDTVEFIELFDGGRGQIDLSGLVVVLWNGRDDTLYATVDLTGHTTNAAGYFVLGRAGLGGVDLVLPAAGIQNGPDAVALYAGQAADFPNGLPLSVIGLRDALVYGPADAPDEGLLTLLEAGQSQANEGERGDATADALQRCPNGAGGARRTATYRAAVPTPGRANECILDDPPGILAVRPLPDSTGVAPTATLAITFTEPVELNADWINLACGGDAQAVTTLPGDTSATVVPGTPLPAGTTCIATIRAAAVADRDAADPPDHPQTDYTWQFETAAAPPPLVAGFTHNGPVWIEATVIFTNTTTGPGAPTFLWDFGDGQGATTANPTHRYAAAGTYTVTLTATSGATTALFSSPVLVRPRAVYAPLVVR